VGASSRTNVLIVDDERIARDTMSMILSAEHAVQVAGSADEALTIFRAGEFAVVVCDFKMPGRNGIDLLEEIALRDPVCARILLTAYGNRGAIIDAVNRGKIFLYLDKPCDPATLRVAVRRGAERWVLEREREQLALRLRDMEKVAAVGRFASSVAHDIRNYLVPILVAASEKEPSNIRQSLETAKEASEAILALVVEMQALAKGRPPSYRLSQGSVEEVLEEATGWLRRSALARKREIRLDVEPLPPVLLYAGSLRRVFINLVKNALEASPEGSAVTVRARRRGREATVAVEDHGTGMSPEVSAKVFEPFFSTKGEEGTGLGLYICRTIVSGHGGTITLESTEGTGTTFTVALPLA
jgi:signal transduction histidine kinase